MKRILCALIFLMLMIGMIPAQTRNQDTVVQGFYEVSSDGGAADASFLAGEMNLMFEVFNNLFRFDPKGVSGSFKVTAFTSENAYNDYVFSKLNSTRPGAVYLHYTNPERRELIVHRTAGVSPKVLAHQAFIQYFRGFIPNPPSWMRDGFAIFFNTLSFDKAAYTLNYEENLAWLETVKSWGADAPAIESIMMADVDGIPNNFQPASWALTSFLLNNDNEEYHRILFESIMLLSKNATAEENTLAITQRVNSWIDIETFKEDYNAYFAARKTFSDCIEEGRIAYNAKDPFRAEIFFLEALTIRPNHYVPYYYLGLLAYEAKKYDEAEQYYRSALQFGADQALLQYAMGLNALSADRLDDARYFLRQSSALSPERYSKKVLDLLARIDQAKR